jgi:peptide/nickel transport system permease protein
MSRTAVWWGGATLGLLVATVVAGPLLVSADPYLPDLAERLRGPGAAHVLGRDALGRDVLARLVVGGRISLAVGFATLTASLTVGVVLGTLAGYFGGWVDEVLARLTDVLLAFPGLLLAIALAAVLGPSVPNVILALSLLGWTGYFRVARAQVAALRRRDYVQAAAALGARPARIMVRHVLPAAAPALLVQGTFGLAGAVIAEASLSFLGLGAPPPLPSWGAMIAEGRPFLLVAPHLTLFPGVALASTVLVLHVLGDALRDVLDVRDRQR